MQERFYTSYYAKAGNFDQDKFALISIAGKAPEWWQFAQYKRLAPSWDIWKSWHDAMANAAGSPDRIGEELRACQTYVSRFNAEILGNRDPQKTVDNIRSLSSGRVPVLFCYEVPGKFCHRHLVAEWIMKHNSGIIIDEYDFNVKPDVEVKTDIGNL